MRIMILFGEGESSGESYPQAGVFGNFPENIHRRVHGDSPRRENRDSIVF